MPGLDHPSPRPTLTGGLRRAVTVVLVLLIPAALAAQEPVAVPQYLDAAGILRQPGNVPTVFVVDLLAFVSDASGRALTVVDAAVDGGHTLTANGDGTYRFQAVDPTFEGEATIDFHVENERSVKRLFTLVLSVVSGGGGGACPDPDNPECPAPCPDPTNPDCPAPGVLTPPTGLDAQVIEVPNPNITPSSARVFINLVWQHSGSVADGFYIRRREDLPGEQNQTIATLGANQRLYGDSLGVFGETSPWDFGHTYVFTVVAFAGSDETPSAELRVTPTFDPPLRPPSDVLAIPGEHDKGEAEVTIIWTDEDRGNTGFSIYRDGVFLQAVQPGTAISAFDLTAVAGNTYTYTVTSVRDGTELLLPGESPFSNTATVTLPLDQPLVQAANDPQLFDDPRFYTESDTEKIICQAAILENDVPTENVSTSLSTPDDRCEAGVCSLSGDACTVDGDCSSAWPPPGQTREGGHLTFVPNAQHMEACVGVLYSPPAGFFGTDRYVYRLIDLDNTSVTDYAVVSLRVNAPPVAAVEASCSGLLCRLDGSSSSDPGSSNAAVFPPGIVNYQWSIDGETIGFGPVLDYQFAAGGTTDVVLTVVDSEGSSVAHAESVAHPLPPVAAFAHSCPPGGLLCSFDASSSTDPDGTIVDYAWSFGDGTTDHGQGVTHEFPDSGTFDVRLTVTDDQGLTDSKTLPVTIDPIPPQAGFTHDCSGGLSCTFDAAPSADIDGSIVAWRWDFGDGGPGATTPAPAHSYAVKGSYTATLTVTDDDGLEATASEPLTVSALPVPGFTHSCDGLSCTFDASSSTDDGGVTSYAWRFGSEASGGEDDRVTVTHTFLAEGVYDVTLIVADAEGQSAELTRPIPVSAKPVASFFPSCSGLTCTFDASASSDDGTLATYIWDFGDGTGTEGSDKVVVTHPFADGVDALVTLTVRDDMGQEASYARSLRQPLASFVEPVPCDGLTCTFDASGSSDDVAITSYSWDFGDGTTGNGPVVVHPYAVKGTYNAVLTVTDSDGLQDVKGSPVTVSAKPVASFTDDCDQLTCTFDASASSDDGNIDAYSWRFGDQLGSASGPIVPFTFPARGVYLVHLNVIDDDGQVSPKERSVSVSLDPVAVIGGGEPCNGLTCTFNASGSSDDGTIDRYDWDFGDGTTAVGKTPAPHTYPVKGSYTVTLTVTDDNHQTKSASAPVSVSKKPVAAFPPPVCNGLSCPFDGRSSTDDGAISAYHWSFGDGTTGSSPTPTHLYPTKGTYTVVLTVTDDMGQNGSKQRSVTASRKPTASFTFDSCPDHLCTFDGTGSSDDVAITSYSWDFGDGATGSGPIVTHPYPPGLISADVRLSVTDELNQVGTKVRTVPIVPPDVDLPVASGGVWEFFSPTTLGVGRTEQIPIANRGPNPLHLTNPGNMVAGPCFQQVTTPPAVVPPDGGSVTVGVRMLCTSGVLGTKTGTLTVRSDDPDEDPYTLTLQGQLTTGTLPDNRLEVTYSPAPGQPRASYVSNTAHPADEVAFYYDPNLGSYEERSDGSCPSTVDNPTYVRVRLAAGSFITGCTYQMSWDATEKTCPAQIVTQLNQPGGVVIGTDDFTIDPATCMQVEPLAPHVRYGEDHHIKITLLYNGGRYPRRIDIRQASKVDYLPIDEDTTVLQVVPTLNLGQDWGLSISNQTSAKAYTILKVSPTVPGSYQSAALWLHGTSSAAPPAGSVYQLRTTAGWDESSLTWNNWSTLTGGLLRSLGGLGSIGGRNAARANVTTAVNASGVYGLRLATNASSSYTFFSGESANAPPYLVITTLP